MERGGSEVPLLDWAHSLLVAFSPVAARLDAAHAGRAHADALSVAEERLRHPETTPSARALQVMQSDFDGSFAAFVLAQSEQTRAAMTALPYSDELAERFRVQAQASVAAQRAIEAADTQSFEDFRRGYLSPACLTLAA